MSAQEQAGRTLSLNEHGVLLWVLCELGESEAAAVLHDQSRTVSVAGGLPTMLELSVPAGTRGAPLPDGPLPVRAIVTGEAGGPIGEVLVWISGGCLSTIEHAWYTDEPPIGFPCPSVLRVG